MLLFVRYVTSFLFMSTLIDNTPDPSYHEALKSSIRTVKAFKSIDEKDFNNAVAELGHNAEKYFGDFRWKEMR